MSMVSDDDYREDDDYAENLPDIVMEECWDAREEWIHGGDE